MLRTSFVLRCRKKETTTLQGGNVNETKMKNPIWNEQIVHPEISCPFPSQISPHYETVKAHTLDWAQRLGLTPYQTALQYYQTADYPGLACRTYPRAGLEELFLVSDWLFLIFVFDDPFDEGAFDNKTQEML